MLKVNILKPASCAICGNYLTASGEYAQRCLEPGHWLAAGKIAPADFYSISRLAAQIRVELPQQIGAQQNR